MKRYTAAAILALLFIVPSVSAQRADVTLSVGDSFFDALLDSVFQNFDAPSFPIMDQKTSGCDESIKLLREMNGVRTAVRFRDGKVYVPLAFSGHYSAPFVGCMDFAGVAEANIDLEFDREGQRLIGRAHVQNVNLNGTGGLGGPMIARTLQNSIDKKLNPIEILKIDNLSFGFPIRSAGSLRMKAVGLRTEVTNGQLNIIVTYEFLKG
jgi:hypothetical protein